MRRILAALGWSALATGYAWVTVQAGQAVAETAWPYPSGSSLAWLSGAAFLVGIVSFVGFGYCLLRAERGFNGV